MLPQSRSEKKQQPTALEWIWRNGNDASKSMWVVWCAQHTWEFEVHVYFFYCGISLLFHPTLNESVFVSQLTLSRLSHLFFFSRTLKAKIIIFYFWVVLFTDSSILVAFTTFKCHAFSATHFQSNFSFEDFQCLTDQTLPAVLNKMKTSQKKELWIK